MHKFQECKRGQTSHLKCAKSSELETLWRWMISIGPFEMLDMEE